MLSVHPRHFKDSDGSKYSEGWCNPGSKLSKERGSVSPAVPVDTFEPKNVATYLAECCVSPIVWEKGKRKQDYFIGALWLALDFDDGKYTLAEALDDFKEHACVIGTTKSHGLVKGVKPACDRFRVFVRGNRFIQDVAKFKTVMKFLVVAFGSDKACVDAARYFYPCREIVFVGKSNGLEIDVECASVDPPEKIKMSPPKNSKKRIEFQKMRKNRMNVTTSEFLEYGIYGEGTGRNVAIYKVACELLRHRYSAAEIIDIVRGKTDLPEKEIALCVVSAGKAER